jgi:hypothetical protein
MCLYAGTGVAAIHDLPTAAQVIERLIIEMEKAVFIRNRTEKNTLAGNRRNP